MIRLGIGTYKEQLQKNIDCDIDHFDILELQDFVMPDNLEKHSLVRQYRSILNGYGGEITIHGPYLNLVPTSLDKRISAVAALRYMQAVNIANKLGAKQLVIHSCYDSRTGFAGYEDMWLEDNIAFWQSFLEKSAGSNVRILLENIHDPAPEVFVRLIAVLDSPFFSSCLDIGHCNCFSQCRPEEWITRNPGSYYHISDNDGVDDRHLPIGQGTLNIAGIAVLFSKQSDICLVSEAYTSFNDQLHSLNYLKDSIEAAEQANWGHPKGMTP